MMLRMPPVWRLVRVALLLGFFSFASRELNLNSWAAGGVTILWPTNGLLLGILLCSSKRHWAAYLSVAFVMDLLLNLSLGDSWYFSSFLSTCNALEALTAGLLLYGTIAAKPDLTRREQLIPFLAYGVFLSPLIASFIASFVQNGYISPKTFHNIHRWFTGDALGIATVTPLFLAFYHKDRFASRSLQEVLGLFILLGGVTASVFWQNKFPLLFLVLPFLILVGLRLGLAASAMGLLLVSILGGLLTTAGHGPLALAKETTLPERDLVFQSFIAVSMLLLYILEARMAENERLRANIEASERRFRLLAEASSDIIFRCDLDGSRSYVSPSVTEVLGWRPEEVLEGTYEDLVHPDDRAELAGMLQIMRNNRESPPYIQFRYRKTDGSYIWLEFNLRLFYDDDRREPAGYVKIARDISRRKLEEAALQQTLETAEQLASSDALTGIANRRHFDRVIEREWLRAARERTSLSVLLIDVDKFKAYNDFYGHLSGDDCLRRMVAAMKPVISRPADLLARYGGEEFVVVLPNTDALGAKQMAEWIRAAVETCSWPHPGNSPHAVITLSIGCATLVPNPGLTPLHLLERADQALYRAKSAGRNRVEVAAIHPEAGSVLLMN